MAVPTTQNKKLKRLPHVFGKVLELPFKSETDVSIEEHPGFFRFVAEANNCPSGDLTVHAVEVHPGIKKVVIRGRRTGILGGSLLIDELELDVWRFRLPAVARAEAAKAVCGGGKLVVTVPKSGAGGTYCKGGRGHMANLLAGSMDRMAFRYWGVCNL